MMHTPGPWLFDSELVAVVDANARMFICDVRGWGPLSTQLGEEKAIEIQEANGRLIASAPRMLGALEFAKSHFVELLHFGTFNDLQKETLQRWINEIDEVIKEARGKS